MRNSPQPKNSETIQELINVLNAPENNAYAVQEPPSEFFQQAQIVEGVFFGAD